MITCITISEYPWEIKSLPRSIRHTNIVAGKVDQTELHKLKLEAIQSVDTHYLFFQDREDPVPANFLVPLDNTGFATGPVMITDHTVVPPVRRVMTNEIHHTVRSFMHTKKAARVASLMPQGYFDTEYLLHFFLEKRWGITYNRSLMLVHYATPGRPNGIDPKAVENSKKWARSNEMRVLWALEAEPQPFPQ